MVPPHICMTLMVWVILHLHPIQVSWQELLPITVKDANNCTYSTSVTLTTTIAPTASINYANTPFCSLDTSVQLVTLDGTGAYTGGVFFIYT